MFGLIICSIFNWVICLYNCWVVNVLFIFWIQVPYQIYNLQIFPLRLWTFHSFIYLFIFGCPGSSSLCGLFSGFSELGLPSSCGVQASHCCGFSCCGAWALGCVGFNSCSSWALEDKLYSCGTHRLGFFFKQAFVKSILDAQQNSVEDTDSSHIPLPAQKYNVPYYEHPLPEWYIYYTG